MSTELQIPTENGQSMAELMGIKTNTGSSAPRTARLTQVQTAVKSMVEVNGKKMNMEVIPVGSFALKVNDDTTVYSDTVSIRLFLQREQWTRWNSGTNEMEKSILAADVRNDLMDNQGGFNLGRPSGYIEDFNALPESTKDLVRSVKRTRVVFGVLTLDNPMNADGEPLSETYENVPFVYDIKNNKSMKALDGAIKTLTNKNALPIMGWITLSGETDTLPNGNSYGFISAKAGGLVELAEEDNDTLKAFLETISAINTSISDAYYAKRDNGLSSEDAALVGSIVDVEE